MSSPREEALGKPLPGIYFCSGPCSSLTTSEHNDNDGYVDVIARNRTNMRGPNAAMEPLRHDGRNLEGLPVIAKSDSAVCDCGPSPRRGAAISGQVKKLCRVRHINGPRTRFQGTVQIDRFISRVPTIPQP